MRPRCLDLFCGAGGAARGYAEAGFEVIGVDIVPQPRYPYEFHLADALEFPLGGFDLVHASPPCQAYTAARVLRGREHPDLVAPTRQRLAAEAGGHWVIENVVGAPLIRPVILCGAMFPGLRVYRHRLFEASFPLEAPEHPPHTHPLVEMGRAPGPAEWIQVVGHFTGAAEGRRAMGIDWMTRDELAEAIPPAYTRWVGAAALAALGVEARP